MTTSILAKTERVFDFTQATNRQLYNIATDPEVRMGNRYDAVRELQRRRNLNIAR